MPPETHIAVVGSGAAGLSAACVVAESCRVALLTDRQLGTSNSVMAQGGLHVPFATAASHTAMVDDMLRSGINCDEELVKHFVQEIRPSIRRLESWGLSLDSDETGQWTRSLAGGLSEPRIIGTGDSIGPSVIRVLRRRLRALTNASVFENSSVCDVVLDSQGRVRLTSLDGDCATYSAVIFATGGVTYQWASDHGFDTTNPPNGNQAAAQVLQELGIPSINDDSFQWHPFGIVRSVRSSRPIKAVPETICNQNVALLDVSGNEVAPIRSGRRKLSEAAFAAGNEGRLLLDRNGRHGLRLTTSRLAAENIRVTYPHLARTMERLGLMVNDVVDDIVVWPAPHYQLGGLERGTDCSTTIPGIFVAGELAGGVHGVNRLMGNGLTESIVTGIIAAQSAVDFVRSHRPTLNRKRS